MGYPRERQERRGWAFGFCVLLVEPFLKLLTRQHWVDGEKIPARGGCVVVGNHLSHVDPFTFAHFVYGYGRLVRFLAKAEVFAIPVAGRLARVAGQIPVHRLTSEASSAFQAAVEAVQRGECVAVYPEGTLTRQPDLWPMTGKTGAARIALETDAPVIPVAQWGPQEILPPYARFPRLLPRRTITVKAGDPVALDDLRVSPLTPQVLQEATDRIMTAITHELEWIRGEQAPSVRFDSQTAGVREIGNPYPTDTSRRTRGNGVRP